MGFSLLFVMIATLSILWFSNVADNSERLNRISEVQQKSIRRAIALSRMISIIVIQNLHELVSIGNVTVL